MKLTIRTIIKALTVIIIVLFLGPSLLSYFERPSGEESFKAHRRQVKHSDNEADFLGDKPYNSNGGGAKADHLNVSTYL